MEIGSKTFIVTGAASGLGEATARMIVKRGGYVVLADINPAGKRLPMNLASALLHRHGCDPGSGWGAARWRPRKRNSALCMAW